MFQKVIPTLVAIFLVTLPATLAQEVNKVISLNGYISSMQNVTFEKAAGDWTNDNLLHNRLNFRFYPWERLTLVAEARTRLFTGDIVRNYDGYDEMIGGDRGWIDMSWNLASGNSVLLNTTVDRLNIDYRGNGFQITLGRQRINWGQTFVWNPNDIFNAYSYFDFDYVERPGSDALRLQLFPSYSSAIELAVKVDSDERVTAGGLVRFNTGGYDVQFITGLVNGDDLVFGTGWSGALGQTSFRGEVSWFQPADNLRDITGTGLFTIGFDRSFSDNSMVQFQVMYCNDPVDFSDFGSFYSGTLSARELAFSEVSIFAACNIVVTPLVSLGLSGIYYPGLKGCFAGPSADVSLAGNTDFSFIWQYFDAELGGDRLRMNLGFLRIKYSF